MDWTALEIPVRKRGGDSANRLLRAVIAKDERNEDRMLNAAIERLAGLVKVGAIKLSNVGWKFLLTGQQQADILNVFHLDRGLKRALVGPNLKLMENYVKEVNTFHRKNKMSVIGIFMAHYGDDAVTRALVRVKNKKKTAQTDEEVKRIRQLQNGQLFSWLDNRKSVDDVFKLLPLGSRKMEVLDDYFKLYNRGRSRQETLLRVLTKGFGGEQKLEDLLVIAKDDARTSELARTLQTALTKEWLTRNIRPEIVLKKLGLNRGATDALLDQNRYTLTAYISLFNEKNPASKKSLLETLLGHYGDVAVAEALTIAESKRATKNLATQMQIQQFQQWQKSGKSAGAIFKQLDIDVDEFLLVMSSKLEALEDYNTTLKVGNLRYKQDTFTVVRKGFGDDVELALVVVRALKTLELENANIPVSTATVYERLLLKRWFNKRSSRKTFIENSLVMARILLVVWKKQLYNGTRSTIATRWPLRL